MSNKLAGIIAATAIVLTLSPAYAGGKTGPVDVPPIVLTPGGAVKTGPVDVPPIVLTPNSSGLHTPDGGQADAACTANCVYVFTSTAPGNYAIFDGALSVLVSGSIPLVNSDKNGLCRRVVSNNCPSECATVSYRVYQVSGTNPPNALTVSPTAGPSNGVFPWGSGSVDCNQ